ncbi:unnamed protein product [Arctogadus glacialis]
MPRPSDFPFLHGFALRRLRAISHSSEQEEHKDDYLVSLLGSPSRHGNRAFVTTPDPNRLKR